MVTRKVTLAAAGWLRGDPDKLKLGNLKARRDWGFAGDYVKAMHAMLQQGQPKDYVIGTGQSHSVEEFIGNVLGTLTGSSVEEAMARIGEYVEIDPRLFRTGEIHDLRADANCARQ